MACVHQSLVHWTAYVATLFPILGWVSDRDLLVNRLVFNAKL